MRVFITGVAGFIGHALALRLLQAGHTVIGIDSYNSYYDVQLKKDRAAQLLESPDFIHIEGDIADADLLMQAFKEHKPTHVMNLAAQAGVRYSIENPQSYIQANLVGFANILEACRHNKIEHLLFASSSSVYGLNTKMPYATTDCTTHQVSLYAATKKANEAMAHSYAHLYRIPCTGLRFFTVYGPWGRPDMALFLFTKAIFEGRPINVFNEGRMQRDFTYIDDIVTGIEKLLPIPATPDAHFDAGNTNPSCSSAPYRLYNIGNNQSVELGVFIDTLEDVIGIKAKRNLLPMQPGDVQATYANIDDLAALTGFAPTMPLQQGIENFVNWYKKYYKIA